MRVCSDSITSIEELLKIYKESSVLEGKYLKRGTLRNCMRRNAKTQHRGICWYESRSEDGKGYEYQVGK